MKPIIRIILAFAASLPASYESWSASRPNVIIIMADDMGWSDIGCYGSEIETPNLDRLANNGLRFTQFYNTGRCCPTRASLLTGTYPHQAGIGWMMSDSGFPGYKGDLGSDVRTIAEVLKPAKYSTYLSGKWHVTPNIYPGNSQHNWPIQRGFDRFYGTIHGAGSFFDPNSLTRQNTLISPFAECFLFGSFRVLALEGVLENAPGTPRYWQKKRHELIGKLENLGPFQLFFTLSCAFYLSSLR